MNTYFFNNLVQIMHVMLISNSKSYCVCVFVCLMCLCSCDSKLRFLFLKRLKWLKIWKFFFIICLILQYTFSLCTLQKACLCVFSLAFETLSHVFKTYYVVRTHCCLSGPKSGPDRFKSCVFGSRVVIRVRVTQ